MSARPLGVIHSGRSTFPSIIRSSKSPMISVDTALETKTFAPARNAAIASRLSSEAETAMSPASGSAL